MTSPKPTTRRRCLLQGSALLVTAGGLSPAREAAAFGDAGAFNPRILLTGTSKWTGRRKSAPARWALELVRRTSAPARVSPTVVAADSPKLLAEPFVIWAGGLPPTPLTAREVQGLRQFIALGGTLFIDDSDPERGAFLAAAKREMRRVLPNGSAIAIGPEHVLFRSFYLLRRATGRLHKADKLEAIIRGGQAQVLFSPNDLLGALARSAGRVHPFQVEPGGERQRQRAVRLAVNIAMYVLCSDYKNDQVHAPFLMRRRRAGNK
jgi:hypothetical protein